MNKFYLSFLLFTTCFSSQIIAQTFSDNFDSYTAGSYLTQSNSAWKTWSGVSGGADDLKISNAKAKSGTNSLYFSASSTTGGPADIVLPFGGEYNTGTMNFSMWMFVDAQKKGYFNLQEQAILGKGWSIDVNFDSIGNFNIVNTTSGLLLNGTYTQNAWMKVELQIDLNSNTWNFLLNGISKGSFQNSYRQISSMDIYPVANSSYYVDDISYTYTPYVKPNLNASLTFISLAGKLAGQSSVPVIEIRNLGTQIVTTATLELTYNSIKQTKSVTGLNLASLSTTLITLDNSITLLSGISAVVAKINLVNGIADDVAGDNSKTLTLNSPTPAVGKMIVAEEATGTWCGWCPRGAVWLKSMDAKYNGLFIGIAVHNNDPMTYPIYDKAIGAKVSGYPSMLIDRGIATDPSAMEADILTRIMVAPKGTIRCGAKYNSTSRVLDVSLTTKFVQSATGNYKIAFVLVEDSVTGTDVKFNQSNYYSGGTSGVMGGFETMANPVPANKMVYDHVGRIVSPNFTGKPNAFATSVNPGDSFTHNFSVVLDPVWSTSRLHLVGLLIDPAGRIDNGGIASMGKAIQNGFTSGTVVLGVTSLEAPKEEIQAYPNPSSGSFNITIPSQFKIAGEMLIYNMQGQLIQTENLKGHENIRIDAQAWTPGVYIGLLNFQGQTIKVKMVKE
ncbi:MAG: T9SS type A sorting domain-containing protein [Bacteroidetes bacterium]|nr:T9SS type A sorting domain-containing protein [Bacteroidota bacterium]